MNGSYSLNATSLSARFLHQLATEKSAPAAIHEDLARWAASDMAWKESRRSTPPNFVAGRLIEPDLAPLDQRFRKEMTSVDKRLEAWVESACAE